MHVYMSCVELCLGLITYVFGSYRYAAAMVVINIVNLELAVVKSRWCHAWSALSDAIAFCSLRRSSLWAWAVLPWV